MSGCLIRLLPCRFRLVDVYKRQSLATLFTHSPVYGQQNVKRISLKLEATSLLEALREINRLSDNVVVFKKEEDVYKRQSQCYRKGIFGFLEFFGRDDAPHGNDFRILVLSLIHIFKKNNVNPSVFIYKN